MKSPRNQVTPLQDPMSSLNPTPQSTNFLRIAEAFALDQANSNPTPAVPSSYQEKINSVLSSASEFIDDWKNNEGRGIPRCDAAAGALEAVRSTLSQHAYMLHLLVRAGAEINGNPFLDEETVLPEVRQFMRQPEIAKVVPEVVFDIRPHQIEIVDDLLDLDSDNPEQTSGGRFIRAADSQKVVSIMMSDVIGDYEFPEQVPEWDWVEKNSTMGHHKNGKEDGIWEFLLNMSRQYSDVPAKLLPVLNEAKSKGVAFLLFHQGT